MQRVEGVFDLLPKGHVFESEILVLDDAGRPLFNELLLGPPPSGLRDLRSADGREVDPRPLPLKECKAALARVGKGADRWIALTDERALSRAVVNADLEGIVAKRLAAHRPKCAKRHKVLNQGYSQRRGRRMVSRASRVL